MNTARYAAALAFALITSIVAPALLAAPRLVANLALGAPSRESDRQFVIPVIVTTDPGSVNPQAFSFRLVSSTPLVNATVQHSGFTDGQPAVFEWQSNTINTVSYVVFYDETVVRLTPGLAMAATHASPAACSASPSAMNGRLP